MDSTGWLAAAQKLDALEEHGASLEDLNTAIAGLSAAVELGIPAPQRFDAFSALSHALRRRFCRCGASADAIACAQAAHQAPLAVMKGFAASSSTTRNGAFVESPATFFCHSISLLLIRAARLRASSDMRATPCKKYSSHS